MESFLAWYLGTCAKLLHAVQAILKLAWGFAVFPFPLRYHSTKNSSCMKKRFGQKTGWEPGTPYPHSGTNPLSGASTSLWFNKRIFYHRANNHTTYCNVNNHNNKLGLDNGSAFLACLLACLLASVWVCPWGGLHLQSSKAGQVVTPHYMLWGWSLVLTFGLSCWGSSENVQIILCVGYATLELPVFAIPLAYSTCYPWIYSSSGGDGGPVWMGEI